jgi:hypothetical protein
MDIEDVEKYLEVKRLIRLRNILMAVSVAMAAIAVAAMLLGYGVAFARSATYGLGLGAMFVLYAYGGTNLTDRLMKIIDAQINRNPEALQYLATRDKDHRTA